MRDRKLRSDRGLRSVVIHCCAPDVVRRVADAWAPRFGFELSGNDPEKPVVVDCASGGRSRRAKQLLTTAGFKRVTDLGPMSAW